MGMNAGIHWTGGWGGIRAGLDVVEKRKLSGPTGNGSLVIQPVASQCSDYSFVTYALLVSTYTCICEHFKHSYRPSYTCRIHTLKKRHSCVYKAYKKQVCG